MDSSFCDHVRIWRSETPTQCDHVIDRKLFSAELAVLVSWQLDTSSRLMVQERIQSNWYVDKYLIDSRVLLFQYYCFSMITCYGDSIVLSWD